MSGRIYRQQRAERFKKLGHKRKFETTTTTTTKKKGNDATGGDESKTALKHKKRSLERLIKKLVRCVFLFFLFFLFLFFLFLLLLIDRSNRNQRAKMFQQRGKIWNPLKRPSKSSGRWKSPKTSPTSTSTSASSVSTCPYYIISSLLISS